MNFQEILSALKESYGDSDSYESCIDRFAIDFNESSPAGGFIQVEQKGGRGQGDEWYSVKYFPEHNVYIKVTGYYSSYDGTEFVDGWDSCKEVSPVTKTVTTFE